MDKEFIITLLETENIGRVSVEKILENTKYKVSDLNELLDSIYETSLTNKRITVPTLESLKIANEKAYKIISSSEKENIEIIPSNSKYYPKQFFDLSNKPIIVYAKGNLDLLNEYNSIAVIGTREPSQIGYKLGQRITEIFVKNNYNIVSGLAIGCDTIAHTTCLDKNGKTIAILANGLDYIYPKENTHLATRIIDNEGLIISEYPIGKKPLGNYFVERDRLQSGLSQAICVIETDIKGGTMHTVGFAEKQERLLSCINHPIENRNHPKVNGNQMLINSNRAFSLGNADEINIFLNSLKTKVAKAEAKYANNETTNNDSQLSLGL